MNLRTHMIFLLGCDGRCKTEVWVRNKYKNLKGNLNEKYIPIVSNKSSNYRNIFFIIILAVSIIIAISIIIKSFKHERIK